MAKPMGSAGTLGTGWGEPEDWGRWTVGPKAEFTLTVPPGMGCDLEFSADVASFLFGERPRQTVSIKAHDQSAGEWVIANTELELKRMPIRLPSTFANVIYDLSFPFLRHDRQSRWGCLMTPVSWGCVLAG